jgi:hypothetical protein
MMKVFECVLRNVYNTGVLFEADRPLLDVFTKCEKRLLTSYCLSVRPHGTTRLPRDGFSWILIRIFRKYVDKTQILSLLEDRCTLAIPRWIFLRIITTLYVSCRQSRNTFYVHCLFYAKSCRSLNNVENYGRDRQTVDNNKLRHMHIACWIPKATHTHTHSLTHYMRYFLLFHASNCYTHVPEYYLCTCVVSIVTEVNKGWLENTFTWRIIL